MDNSGIISQYGFEFQKLVFIYYAIKMNNTDSSIYEGQDDVEIEEEKALAKFQTGHIFCQVKSGTITSAVYEKILLNWLLKIEQAEKFICISEKDFSIPDESFIESFSKKVLESEQKKNALISRVKNKYTTQKNAVDLKSDIKKLLKEAEFVCKSIDTLIEESIRTFAESYCSDTDSTVIHRERFLKLCGSIHKNISQAILKKDKYVLPYVREV